MIVVEGYMDVIALAQAGIEEAVAPLGTALTEHQLERLWKMVDVPVLCFDGDNAGQKAADRAATRALPLLKPGQSLHFVTLPGGQDPDDLIKAKGAAGFEAAIASPRPLIDQIWRQERATGDTSSPEGRAGLQSRVAEQAATIADQLVRKEYERAFRTLFWDEFGWKKQERSAVRGFIAGTREPLGNPAGLKDMARRLDRIVKRAVLLGLSRYPAVLYSHREQIVTLAMPTDAHRQWARLLISASFERSALEESLIDAILQDASLPEQERRNIKHDLSFSFFRADADRSMAESDLGEVINILLFEQEFVPKLERLKADLYANGDDGMDEARWQDHLSLITLKQRNDERLRELKANIEEQMMAA